MKRVFIPFVAVPPADDIFRWLSASLLVVDVPGSSSFPNFSFTSRVSSLKVDGGWDENNEKKRGKATKARKNGWMMYGSIPQS